MVISLQVLLGPLWVLNSTPQMCEYFCLWSLHSYCFIIFCIGLSLLNYMLISRYISYLPLAHIYERANQVMTVYSGVAVGFYQGV